MSGRTLYQVLMLDPSADGSIIALVYRALAKRHHPDHDHTGGAAARMAELNDAYATLSDPVKRVSYDRSLKPGSDRVAVQRDRDRQDAGAWAVAVPVAHPLPDQRGGGEAGPPPAYPPPSGRIMTYGRYRGWSILPGGASRSRLSRMAPAHAIGTGLPGGSRRGPERPDLSLGRPTSPLGRSA